MGNEHNVIYQNCLQLNSILEPSLCTQMNRDIKSFLFLAFIFCKAGRQQLVFDKSMLSTAVIWYGCLTILARHEYYRDMERWLIVVHPSDCLIFAGFSRAAGFWIPQVDHRGKSNFISKNLVYTRVITMNFNKKKVVFVMGATATGKTKLSIDLAIHFSGEAINSNKIQVYKGLDIATNKVTASERQGVPHHLLGFVDPEADYPEEEFCEHALRAIDKIIENGHLHIIVGGSNTYIEALVEDSIINFRANYD
ncbi:hypothetical protein CISIN_1g045245mg, partial [Citrus sinensis]